MFGRAKETARGERGQSLVEFTIVLLLLGIILGGIWDLGRAFASYIIIANAAREGARFGAHLTCLSSDPDQPAALSAAIRKAVTDETAAGSVDLKAMGCDIASHIELVPDPETDGCAAWEARDGSPLQVTASCSFSSEMARITGLGDFNLTGRGTMSIYGNDLGPQP